MTPIRIFLSKRCISRQVNETPDGILLARNNRNRNLAHSLSLCNDTCTTAAKYAELKSPSLESHLKNVAEYRIVRRINLHRSQRLCILRRILVRLRANVMHDCHAECRGAKLRTSISQKCSLMLQSLQQLNLLPLHLNTHFEHMRKKPVVVERITPHARTKRTRPSSETHAVHTQEK